jgi:hypothetical protein
LVQREKPILSGSDPVVPSRVIAILGAVVAAEAALQAALFAAFLVRTIILRPFWDMISWIDAYQQMRHGGSFVSYLWAPHNEHRLLLIRLLTALDVSAFHASGIPFVVAATAALVGAAWLILAELRQYLRLAPKLRALAWLGPMLLLTTAAVVDCSIPINSVFPLSLVFMVAALVLFDSEAERGRHTGTKRSAALLAATLASMANAVGLIAWPVLLWSAWRGDAPRRWLLTIAAAGAIYGLLYLHGLPPNNHGDPAHFLDPDHMQKMGDYLLVYLGLPLSRAPGLGLPARVLGGMLLAAGGIVVVRDIVSSRCATRLDRIGVGLVLAALAAAILAAVGRVDLEPEVKVPIRYVVMVAPLHIGLLALALPFLVSYARTLRREVLVLSAASVFAAILLALQFLAERPAAAAADAIVTTLDRYYAGIREPGMQRVVFPDLAVADRVLAALHQNDTRAP